MHEIYNETEDALSPPEEIDQLEAMLDQLPSPVDFGSLNAPYEIP